MVSLVAVPWYRSTFATALAGGLLLYAAFPPLGVSVLAWVAPVFWLNLVRCRELRGQRPYWGLWSASAIHWLMMLQGIRLAHWANYFGWVALSFYLAIYLPVFVAVSRVAVHELRIPLLVAGPVVWTGLELARGHLITGFSMALMGHTQVEWTRLIQIADLFGGYGVGFLLMSTGVCILQAVPIGRPGFRAAPAAVAAAMLAAVLGYGGYRLNEPPRPNAAWRRPLNVALIQGAVDKVFENAAQRSIDAFGEYWTLTSEARDHHRDLDLIVWPESVFTGGSPDLIAEGPISPPADSPLGEQQFTETFRAGAAAFRDRAREAARRLNQVWQDGRLQQLNISLLVGSETVSAGRGEFRDYNAALLIDPEGQIVDRYYKMHPVMFGEYVPFGDLLPWLYRLTPLRQGLTPGESPRAFAVEGLRLSPSICFESTVPHLIRGHVVRLTRQGTPPDILVNLTDDGWFWGSSILDLQLACAAFRAVELRRPVLVAANTGISAHIDGNGAIRQRGPRRKESTLIARVQADGRRSGYEVWGDLPAGICLATSLGFVIVGFAKRRRNRRASPR